MWLSFYFLPRWSGLKTIFLAIIVLVLLCFLGFIFLIETQNKKFQTKVCPCYILKASSAPLKYQNFFSDGFDIVVNDCFAHNGANKRIPLIDHHGCPVDEKLISRFQGTWGMTNNQYDTLVYAHMKTFRFTGTPALYIECDIRMCHGKCPVSCFFLPKYIFID